MQSTTHTEAIDMKTTATHLYVKAITLSASLAGIAALAGAMRGRG